jgi:hypothetical protein
VLSLAWLVLGSCRQAHWKLDIPLHIWLSLIGPILVLSLKLLSPNHFRPIITEVIVNVMDCYQKWQSDLLQV